MKRALRRWPGCPTRCPAIPAARTTWCCARTATGTTIRSAMSASPCPRARRPRCRFRVPLRRTRTPGRHAPDDEFFSPCSLPRARQLPRSPRLCRAHRGDAMAPRLQIRRHPERALAVPEDAQAILAQGIVAHVGFEQEGWPYVMPMTFLYREGSIFLHGAPGSRIIKTLGAGARCCITVTLLDGLIASKS